MSTKPHWWNRRGSCPFGGLAAATCYATLREFALLCSCRKSFTKALAYAIDANSIDPYLFVKPVQGTLNRLNR
jgi:hypothetical protein